ncbi:protein prenyltransferase alpha subunit repeat-containing domain protein [Ancylostoma duodenale]|uniref:Geranylgeranyl transferase type-2 subunit alpha n=1 Tax=Ancylostoma duodenale TaxID=51022 RepID=A0A0C2CL95_9BILA|nr:protein prenyltransferase alpha subunit repeat-containing domain protein [Ancylostoma duodenale]
MHFVKKVPTSDEEKAAKQKERAIKLKTFCTVRDRIFEKRAKGELDDEMLSLTQKLLEKNPDIYTFWNIRRDTIEKKIAAWKECQSTTEDEECKESCGKKIENLLNGELFLTQSCLEKVTSAFFTDPDDQSAWVYSRWLLEMGSEKEFLKLDSLAPAVPLTVSFHGNNTTFVMSKACTFDEVVPFVNSQEEAGWRGVSALSPQPESARIWQCISEKPCNVQVDQEGKGEMLDVSKQPYVNKWARYMYTLCLMETRPAECHEEILSNLGKLATELDVKRQEIYKKLASRQILNKVLREQVDGQPLLEKLMDAKETQLAIRYAQISSLDEVELLAGLVTNLDVSGNQLTTLDEILLPNLEYLTANENPIKRSVVIPTFLSLDRFLVLHFIAASYLGI